MWAVASSMWAVTSSMHDVQALCGLLQPLCIMHRRYVGCYILYACCTCVMWAVASYMYDVQALCGLLHVLTLTITLIKVQCTARNPNPNTVAANRPKRRRSAATVVGLEFLDTARRQGTKTGNQDGEPRREGTKTGNKD